MPFNRSEMYFKDYRWDARSENDDPRVRRQPDSTLVDRTEGYEVLYFVNSCAYSWWNEPINIQSFQKIERLLRRAPSNLRSHGNLKTWIVNNWTLL